MKLRLCTPEDAAEIAAIYAPYCNDSYVSFEEQAPGVTEIAARITRTLQHFPWLVAVAPGGAVAGYAYAGPHRERAAYRWAADVSVYVASDHHRRGIGRALYTALLTILRELGYFRALAGITLPNFASVALHESVGMVPVGVYDRVGYKAGAWRDVGWWQVSLRPECSPPPEPRSIAALIDTPEWDDSLADGAARIDHVYSHPA